MFKIFTLLSLIFSMFPIFFEAAQKKEELRIVQLLPNMTEPLAIDPALPKNFVAGSAEGEPDITTSVVWGTPEDLAKLRKNPDKIESVFIIARLSSNVAQSGPDEFSGEKDFPKELKEMSYKDVIIEKFKWGKYPVLALQAEGPDGRKIYVAWAGLNSEGENGMVMLFNFVYPDDQKSPTEDELKTWHHFLKDTKELPEKEFQLAYGIDMQSDFTLYSFENVEFKAYAEKRASDQEVLVVIESLKGNAKFAITNITEAILATEWNKGKPCVKIQGEFNVQQGSETTIVKAVITVLLKDVKEFDENLLQLKQNKEKHVAFYEGKPEIKK